mgnify:CR=1 FL=1
MTAEYIPPEFREREANPVDTEFNKDANEVARETKAEDYQNLAQTLKKVLANVIDTHEELSLREILEMAEAEQAKRGAPFLEEEIESLRQVLENHDALARGTAKRLLEYLYHRADMLRGRAE